MGPHFLGWAQDGKQLLFFEPSGTRFQLTYVPTDGSEIHSIDPEGIVMTRGALSPDKSHFCFVAESPKEPPEIYLANLDDFESRQITNINSELKKLPQPETEVISWTSEDGCTIEGLLTYPLGYEKGKRYPLLMVVHGGPMAFFHNGFLASAFYPYPMPCFAEEGFCILRPNPRGSCGYGQKFCCASYIW